jgi:hypothetical protein
MLTPVELDRNVFIKSHASKSERMSHYFSTNNFFSHLHPQSLQVGIKIRVLISLSGPTFSIHLLPQPGHLKRTDDLLEDILVGCKVSGAALKLFGVCTYWNLWGY